MKGWAVHTLPVALALLAKMMILQVCSTRVGREEQIAVENSGTDDEACIRGEHSCRTLSYVFKQTLESGKNGGVHYTVEVKNDQLMPPEQYSFPSDTNMTVRGSGMPKLTCIDRYNGIQFNSNSGGSMEWENIHWYNCSKSDDPLMSDEVLIFRDLVRITFQSCEFSCFSGKVVIITSYLNIDNCNYYNNHDVSFVVTLRQNADITSISNTTFQSNTVSGTVITALSYVIGINDAPVFSFDNGSIVSFYGCQYIANNASLIAMQTSVSELQFINCSFLENTCTSITKPVSTTAPVYPSSEYIIVNSIFVSNKMQNAIFLQAEFTSFQNTHVNVELHHNTFYNNTGSLLSLSSNSVNYPSMFTIHKTVFSYNSAPDSIISIDCVRCNVKIDEVFINNTQLASHEPTAAAMKISFIDKTIPAASSYVDISECIFSENLGTPLAVIAENSGAELQFQDNIMFVKNQGINGGGMYLKNVFVGCTLSTLSFDNNKAFYGGAIASLESTWYCGDSEETSNQANFTFTNNTAIRSGQSVFSDSKWCEYFHNIDSSLEAVSSPPTSIELNVTTPAVFPGQNIVLDFQVQGCLNTLTSCVADVILACDNNQEILCIMNDTIVTIAGPSTILISSITNLTDLVITTNQEPPEVPFQVSLQLICQYVQPLHVKLDVTRCPNGLQFNKTTMTCTCITMPSAMMENYFCLAEQDQVCVRPGYWFGKVDSQPVLSSCPLPFCNPAGDQCQSAQASGYIKLQELADDQCVDNRGGTLCRGCSDNYTFTFEATTCIPMESCNRKLFQPFLVLMLAIAYQLMLGFFLILSLRLNLNAGLGYLYGPLFFIAVISDIPFVSFSFLKTTITVFTSFTLLSLEIFGYIPWCFFTLTPLEHFAFRYLSPAVIAGVLLVTVMVARKYPRCFLGVSPSPVRAVCLLLLLSFWSLAETSICSLDYVILDGVDSVRVSLQPDLHYLSREHIPVWIVSILVLVVIIIPFVLLLLIAPILSRRCNFICIKPLLDEFQSCFRDNYRSYSAIYFIAWLSFRFLLLLNQYSLLQILLVLLATTQSILSPYESKWLNITDTVLLWSLVTIFGLFQTDRIESIVLIHVLILSSLLYFFIGFSYMVVRHIAHFLRAAEYIRKLRARKKCAKYPTSLQDTNCVPVSVVTMETDQEREPLLGVLENSDND